MSDIAGDDMYLAGSGGESNDDSAELRSRVVARILIVADKSEPDDPDYALPSVRRDDAIVEGGVNANGSYGQTNGSAPNGRAKKIKPTADDIPPIEQKGSPGDLQTLIDTLTQAGHYVALTTRYDWEKGMRWTEGKEKSPELIVVEAASNARSRDFARTADFCRNIKPTCDAHACAILVTLPPLRARKPATDRARSLIIDKILDAGADDVLIANATEGEVMARTSALVHMSRLRSELEATREHLRLHMQTDDVTKLLNRRFFFQAAHREYGRARRYGHELACLMLSVDFFKRFNTMFGYDCGDTALRLVANVLRDNTRDSDVLARFSEDKFVVLLPETTIEGAISVRENVQRTIDNMEFNWSGNPLPLSVSTGEAARKHTEGEGTTAGDIDEPEEIDDAASLSLREEVAELLAEADAALYVARRGVRFPTIPDHPAAAQRQAHISTFDDLPSLSD